MELVMNKAQEIEKEKYMNTNPTQLPSPTKTEIDILPPKTSLDFIVSNIN
jgi:hypothetical protein